MKNYKFLSIACFFIFLSFLQLQAQSSDTRPAYTVGPSANGPSYSLNYVYQNVNIKGSPFLNEQWQLGNLISKNGSIFKSVNIKFDIYNQKFIFNRNDSSFEVPDAINEVIIYPNPKDTLIKAIYQKGHIPNNQNAFVQVFVEGKFALYKYVKKDIQEYTEYGNATKFQQYADIEQFYYIENGKMENVNISKKNFEKYLKGKTIPLDSFIKEKSLSGKALNDWMEAIQFLNANNSN
jgi:hypothetical protein